MKNVVAGAAAAVLFVLADQLSVQAAPEQAAAARPKTEVRGTLAANVRVAETLRGDVTHVWTLEIPGGMVAELDYEGIPQAGFQVVDKSGAVRGVTFATTTKGLAVPAEEGALHLAVVRGPNAGVRQAIEYAVRMTIRAAAPADEASFKALLPRQEGIQSLENDYLELAIDRFRESIARLEALGPQADRERSLTYTLLGAAEAGRPDLPAAEQAMRQSLDVLTKSGQGTLEEMVLRNSDLGTVLRKLERVPDAVTAYRQAKAWSDKMAADEPLRVTIDLSLALALQDTGQYAESEALFRDVLRRWSDGDRTFDRVDPLAFLLMASSAAAHERPATANAIARVGLRRLEDSAVASIDELCRAQAIVGGTAAEMGRHEEAFRIYRLVRQFTRGNRNALVCRSGSLVAEATLLFHLERFDEGQRVTGEVIEAARHISSKALASSILNLEGGRAAAQGQLDDALRHFEAAIEAGMAAGESDSDLLPIRSNLIQTYERMGKHQDSERLIESVMKNQDRRGGNSNTLARIMQSLARIRAAQGSFIDAEEWFLDAERTTTNPADSARILTDLARMQESIAPDRALATVERALALLDKSGLRATRGTVLLERAFLEEREGRHNAADASLTEALALLSEAYGREAYETVEAQLAAVDFFLTRGDQARTFAALARLQGVFDRGAYLHRPLIAAFEHNFASALYYRGAPGDLEAAITHAIRSRDLAVDQLARAESLLLTAMARRKLGDRAGAIADLKEAASLGTRVVPAGHEASRAKYLAKWTRMYSQLAAWHIEDGDVAEGFRLKELSRGRVLLEQMGDPNPTAFATATNAAAGEYAARCGALSRARYELRAELEKESKDSSDTTLLARLRENVRLAERACEDAYTRRLQQYAPWRMRLEDFTGAATLGQLQPAMEATGAVTLSYDIGSERSYLVVVSGKDVHAHELRIDNAVASAIGVPEGPLGRTRLQSIVGRLALTTDGGTRDRNVERVGRPMRAGEPRDHLLHALWRILIPEALWRSLIAEKHVVVIPDASLFGLPFEMLIAAPVRPGTPPTYWLNEGPPISYSVSATFMLRTNARRDQVPTVASRRPVLTVSDPVYALDSPSDTKRSAGLRSDVLKRLLFTGVESDAIERELPGKVDRLSREQATERRVREAITSRRWLHIATHGLSGTESSLFAALALTPGPREKIESADDGLFELHEIRDLNLAGTEMAVLSACDTNVGSTIAGEGVFALARGFLSSGARRVVATQWSVDDQSTAILMREFFRQLAEDERKGRAFDYAGALKHAKGHVATHGWPDPANWAPFVLIGLP